MLKLFVTIGLVLAVFTFISTTISDPVTEQIDGAIVYFLTYINSLDNIVDATALLTALQIFFNFMVSVGTFWAITFAYSLVGGRNSA